MRRLMFGVAAVLGGALLVAGAASAGVTPEAMCLAKKNQEAGKYAYCLQKAEMKLVKTKGVCSRSGETVCYLDQECPEGETCAKDTSRYEASRAKCQDKFTGKWERWEDQAEGRGAVCPTSGDGPQMYSFVSDQARTIFEVLALGRFKDNGDGTVTDHKTKLMWEKKTGSFAVSSTVRCSVTSCTDPHHVNNLYAWSAERGGTLPDGGAFTEFLAKLNGLQGHAPCFAGYCDWRLPTLEELHSIVVEPRPCTADPCIDPAFGPSAPGEYWTSSTFVSPDDNVAWPELASIIVFSNSFSSGPDHVSLDDKGESWFVRAVRGGL